MPIKLTNPFHKNQKKENSFSRDALAKEIRTHRKMHFDNRYNQRRNLSYLKETYQFDFLQYAQQKFPQHTRIRILDSGAGHASLAHDIKTVLGSKAHVSTLTIISPKGTTSTRAHASTAQVAENLFYPEAIRDYTHAKSKAVDHIHVISAEKLKTKQKFDIILDLHGPLLYSIRPDIVFNNYLHHLSSNGVILTTAAIVPAGFLGELTDIVSGKKFKIVIKEATPKAGLSEMRVEWL